MPNENIVLNKWGAEFDFSALKINYGKTEAILSQMAKMEEELIKKVVSQFLKREATIEDAPFVSRIFKQGFPTEYAIRYKGILLGTVKYSTPELFQDRIGCFYNIQFTPSEEFK